MNLSMFSSFFLLLKPYGVPFRFHYSSPSEKLLPVLRAFADAKHTFCASNGTLPLAT